jgi:hypothetical protein
VSLEHLIEPEIKKVLINQAKFYINMEFVKGEQELTKSPNEKLEQ